MAILDHIKALEQLTNKERGNYIKKFLEGENIRYTVQSVKELYLKGQNIITDYPFNNTGPNNDKKILLCAHFNKYLSSPGANDNATGVSVLLEFIRRLKTENKKGIRLRFVFFDLEDGCFPFLAGSRYYIKKNGTEDLAFVLNVDMVGIGDTVIIEGIKKTHTSPFFQKMIRNIRQDFTVEFYDQPYYGITPLRIPVAGSDHTSFLLAGFECACTVTTDFQKDKAWRDIFRKGKTIPYLKIRLFRMLKQYSSLPSKARVWHTPLDTSALIDRQTVSKVFDVLWKTIIE